MERDRRDLLERVAPRLAPHKAFAVARGKADEHLALAGGEPGGIRRDPLRAKLTGGLERIWGLLHLGYAGAPRLDIGSWIQIGSTREDKVRFVCADPGAARRANTGGISWNRRR